METMTDATKIRLCETPPFVCSSCGGQYVDRQHVDFNAAWDGPVMDTSQVAGMVRVSIDELVICDECLRAAAKLLGLVDPGELAAENATLERRNQELVERTTGALQYVQKLEAALAERGDLEELLKPKEATS
jgi:hypothetical protein